ncbi:MAG: hypothetical protein LBI03_00560 [Clostridiales bacterium]|jgi:hypothetical protein|nr:hypothetical protein [Clostridiales bacterium]
MNGFISFELLGTWSVCITVTTLLTQFIKRFITLDPQVISCILSVILLQLATVFTVGWNLSEIILTFINGIILGLSANGVYDVFNKE